MKESMKPQRLKPGDMVATVSLSWGGAGDDQILWRYHQGKDRLEQVFINLIENANKYAYDNSSIKVTARRENNKAIIMIQNEADYIEKQILEKLFDKFTRIEDQTTRTTRGTGLGLFIVKGLVNAMNGSIYLKSTVDNVFSAQVILPVIEEI